MKREYYEREMQYLVDAGREFAAAHPRQARYLNLENVAERDPSVERLFEGFAFLAARVHERLDEEMPEYAEPLLNIVAPDYLFPLPAVSIAEFTPKPGIVQGTTVLPKGTRLESDPAGQNRIVCVFGTTHDVVLQPLRLRDTSLEYEGRQSQLTLHFDFDRGVDPSDLDLSTIRLYLHAPESVAATMHYYLTRKVTYVRIESDEDHITPRVLTGQKWVRPGGLSAGERLVEDSGGPFSAFGLLREYFSFRRKFWFVDVQGADRASFDDSVASFRVVIGFDGLYPEDRRIGPDEIRLHAAPIVNVMDADAEPILVEGFRSEYRVRPTTRHREGVEVFDVTGVVGMEESTGKRHHYTPFYTFEHLLSGRRKRHFLLRRGLGPTEQHDIFLSLGGRGGEDGDESLRETLSVGLRCTNGSVPHQRLKVGSISRLGSEVDQVADVRNLTNPTPAYHAPASDKEDYYWALIQHWACNYESVANRTSLLRLLDLYDWSAAPENARRREGVVDVSWRSKDRWEKGTVVRGAELELTIRRDHFEGEGDVCLFGLVLSEVFRSYATINSFVDLVITIPPDKQKPQGQRFEWASAGGNRPPL